MESKLSKIVLCDNKNNPIVVISENGKFLRGLEIVQKEEQCASSDKFSHLKLSSEELEKIKYRGKKLDNPIIDFSKHRVVRNLEVREIANIKEDTYYKILRKYVNYHTYMGATDLDYLLLRNDVHDQLIKKLNK